MGRKKKVINSPNSHLFLRNESYTLPNGKVVEKNQVIKIQGEWGTKFKFQEHVVRKDTGVEWIDCFELERGVVSVWRSFRPDRIKTVHVPKRRNRRKSV